MAETLVFRPMQVFPVETGNFVDFRDKPAVFLRKQEGKSDACERSRRNAVAMRTGKPRGLKRGLNLPNRGLLQKWSSVRNRRTTTGYENSNRTRHISPPCQNEIKDKSN
jgi:hypothetical protein